MISESGFEFYRLKKSHPNPFDLNYMLEFLKDYPKEDLWLVVDGYHFNENYHHKLKNIGVRLIVFDDIGHLKFYSADIIINQNIFAKKIKYSRSSDSKLLLGEKYFLLRNEFLRVKKIKNTDILGEY